MQFAPIFFNPWPFLLITKDKKIPDNLWVEKNLIQHYDYQDSSVLSSVDHFWPFSHIINPA